MFRRRRRRPEEPSPPLGSLRWNLKYANPRGLSKAEYVAAERAQRAITVTAGEPRSDLEAANQQLRAAYRRGRATRQGWLGPPPDKQQQIAMFEARMAREAARRR